MQVTIRFNENPGLFVGSDDMELTRLFNADPSIHDAFCELAAERIETAFPGALVEYEQDEYDINWIRTSPPGLADQVQEILTDTFQDTEAWILPKRST